jgi:hypothetical protein
LAQGGRLGHGLELAGLGDDGAGVAREAGVGHPVADDPDHRRHAGDAVHRGLGVGDHREAADLPAGGRGPLGGGRPRRRGQRREDGQGEWCRRREDRPTHRGLR